MNQTRQRQASAPAAASACGVMDYDPDDNARKSYDVGIAAMRERVEAGEELVLAAKEAAVIIADTVKAAGVSPRGPGFDRLMAAIKRFETLHG